MSAIASKSSRIELPAAIAAVVIALGLAGCGAPSDQAPRDTKQGAAVAPSSPTVPPASTALPADATPSGTPAGTTQPDTAKASDPPMESMTKQAESKSMPMPGQANDHSTLAKDPKK